jgi:plasmid replication initiation protein
MKKTKKSKGIALIKKSNNLIESRYKFDLWEMRFFLSVLAKIEKDDQDFEVYRIRYKDVIKDFGIKTNRGYELLKDAAKSISDKNVVINYEENGIIRAEKYHIIRKINYLETVKGLQDISEHEYIDVTIEPELRPFLLQLSKNFTAYDLRNVAKLGAYSIRIYELLKQYESIGTRTIDIDEMKLMLDVVSEYSLFANFYQSVIQPSIKEINKYTDLKVLEPEKIKEGKKVTALVFKFVKKSNDETKKARGEAVKPKTLFDYDDTSTSNIEEAEIIEVKENEQAEKDKLYLQFEDIVVKNFGVTPSVFIQLASSYNAEQIEQAIRVTRRARVNAQIKTNVSGYFVKALKEGYTDIKEEQGKKKEAEAYKQAEAKKSEMEIRAEQEKLLNDKVRHIVEKNPTITEKAIEALKNDDFIQRIVEIKQNLFGRTLKIQDYREDKVLMNAVKLKIIELNTDNI